MSYRLAVLDDLPYAFWPLDETTGATHVDASGLGFTGTQNATTPGTLDLPGLVKGMRAVRFTGTQVFTASPPNIMMADREGQAFAYEVWFKPLAPPTAPRLVMGKGLGYGIVVTPGTIEFRATDSAGNLHAAQYIVTDWSKPFHVVGNYVGGNLGIIVNGQEGLNDDMPGTFGTTTNTVFVGGGTSDSPVTIDVSAPAIYRNPLDIRQVTAHYDYGRLAARPLDIAQTNDGTYYALDDSTTDILFSFVEDKRADFELGTNNGLIYTEDYISAVDGAAGTHDTDLQYVGHLSNIAGSRIDWKASSAVSVSISWDRGATWTACTNHAEVPGLAAGAALTDRFFILRKTFPAESSYTVLLDRLSLNVYGTKTSRADKGDSTLGVTGNPVYAENAASPLERVTEMGVRLNNTSFLTIPARAEGIGGIEMWFRRDADAGAWSYVYDTGGTPRSWLAFDPANAASSGGATFYINGVEKAPVATDFPVGRWVHVLASFGGLTTNSILLNAAPHNTAESGTHSYAHVVTFPHGIDARTASVRYQMSLGLVNIRHVDLAAVSVRELPAGIRGYSYAWSSVQNGIS